PAHRVQWSDRYRLLSPTYFRTRWGKNPLRRPPEVELQRRLERRVPDRNPPVSARTPLAHVLRGANNAILAMFSPRELGAAAGEPPASAVEKNTCPTSDCRSCGPMT